MAGKLYKCNFCGLHYNDKETADRCYAWCTAHNACNLEITRNSVERRSKK
ncbi:MAG: hypothetical protein LVQ95_05640 [Candidatus Micrarchaeales archaeon]|nr:hypothetical protein [Candidatus Micrarchaeales archaeon]